jgi:hypothetical protein
VRILQRCSKWRDRSAEALDEMNTMMAASSMAPHLRRSLRRHLRRSAQAVLTLALLELFLVKQPTDFLNLFLRADSIYSIIFW